MNRMLLFAGLAAAITFLSGAQASPPKDKAEAVKIPLDQIWAYNMPGTRKIEELDDAPREIPGNGLLGSLFKSQLLRADKLRFKDMARPGFAVSGSARSALRAAHAVFVDNAKPVGTFSPDEEIAIVFFSEPVSRYRVEIQQVKRNENEIEIRYELQGSIAGSNFENIALIPLGKMPTGKYQVDMRQLPRERKPVEIKMGFKPLDNEWSRNSLCQPFRFTVTEKAK